jgi:hypothetical protein
MCPAAQPANAGQVRIGDTIHRRRPMAPTRRGFLKYALGATAAGYVTFRSDAAQRVRSAVAATGDTPPDRLAGDEDFRFEVQQAYTVDRSLINLNNGGVSPVSAVVQEAMRRNPELSNQGCLSQKLHIRCDTTAGV